MQQLLAGTLAGVLATIFAVVLAAVLAAALQVQTIAGALAETIPKGAADMWTGALCWSYTSTSNCTCRLAGVLAGAASIVLSIIYASSTLNCHLGLGHAESACRLRGCYRQWLPAQCEM
jgi:hypothetical protein